MTQSQALNITSLLSPIKYDVDSFSVRHQESIEELVGLFDGIPNDVKHDIISQELEPLTRHLCSRISRETGKDMVLYEESVKHEIFSVHMNNDGYKKIAYVLWLRGIQDGVKRLKRAVDAYLSPQDFMISLDGGETFIPAPNGVIVKRSQNGGHTQLEMMATGEMEFNWVPDC